MTFISRACPNLFLNDQLPVADLKGSLLLQAALTVLGFMEEHQAIPLTKSGAFQRKFVVWAVDEFEWPGYTAEELYLLNKVLNEDDVPPLAYLHELLRRSRLVRHSKSKAVLTKKGKAMLHEPGHLQAKLFETYFTHFSFPEHERWPIEYEGEDLEHFLGVIQNRLGTWVGFPELSGWCLPQFRAEGTTIDPQELAMIYLSSRLMRPLEWLGLIEQKSPKRFTPLRNRVFRKTRLFDKFIRLVPPLPSSSALH